MFEELHVAVSKLATTDEWIEAELPEAYPDDYFLGITESSFIKFGVAPAAREKTSYTSAKRLSGLILFSIYYPKDKGKKHAMQVADKLSLLVDNKLMLESKAQTFTGSLQFLGIDPEDNTLSRADYSVPFIFYGE